MLSFIMVQGPLPGSATWAAEQRIFRAGTPVTLHRWAKYSAPSKEPSFRNPGAGVHLAELPVPNLPEGRSCLTQHCLPRGAGTLRVSESGWDAALSLHTGQHGHNPSVPPSKTSRIFCPQTQPPFPPTRGGVVFDGECQDLLPLSHISPPLNMLPPLSMHPNLAPPANISPNDTCYVKPSLSP